RFSRDWSSDVCSSDLEAEGAARGGRSMSAWTHPSLGPIELIPPKLCPKKVWQHFYDPGEHWERVCAVDVAVMRREAEVTVGAARSEERRVGKECRSRR